VVPPSAPPPEQAAASNGSIIIIDFDFTLYFIFAPRLALGAWFDLPQLTRAPAALERDGKPRRMLPSDHRYGRHVANGALGGG
jgi:hypothetical protein